MPNKHGVSSALSRIIFALTIGAVVVVIMREYGKLLDRLTLSAERATREARDHAVRTMAGPIEIEQPQQVGERTRPIDNAEEPGGRWVGPMPWEDDPLSDEFLLDENDAFPGLVQ